MSMCLLIFALIFFENAYGITIVRPSGVLFYLFNHSMSIITTPFITDDHYLFIFLFSSFTVQSVGCLVQIQSMASFDFTLLPR